MEWLAIFGLAVWVWRQSRQVSELKHKLAELEHRLALTAAPTPRAETAAAPATAPAPTYAPEEPLVLDQPLPADEREPLLLDTPLPQASNDDEPLLLTEALPPLAEPVDEPVPAPPAAATPPPRVAQPRERKLEQWLAQNGLAWLGGMMLALGAIFLVSFATQQDWFTPQVQLASALALGLALLGASEWARRAARKNPPGHPLVAAMLAGAGVVTFYATVWAAHALYGMIAWPAAAMLLSLCAAGLIGLSLLHGQALGVLAILMALLTPPFASPTQWPSFGLSVYLCGVGIAGYGLAAFKRWGWVAAVTTAALYFWFSAAIVVDQIQRALAIASIAAIGGVTIAYRKPLADEAPGRLNWTRTHTHLPAAVIAISSVLLIWTWLALAQSPISAIGGPAWVATIFVALAASAVRAQFAAPITFTIAIGSLVFGFMSYLQARYVMPAVGADFYPFALFASIGVALSALWAQPLRSSRTLVAASGAIGAALLTALAAVSREDWHHFTAWVPLFLGAAMLLGAAWHTARDAKDPRTDRAVAFWTTAGAALWLIGIESGVPALLRTTAHAAASAAFAFGLVWRGWTVFRYIALSAAALSIGHALSPTLIAATLGNPAQLAAGLAILAAAASLLFIAGFIAGRTEPRTWSTEALSGAGVIVVLIAAFLGLRWLAAGSAGVALDNFTETSLRVLALIAAGHVLLARPGVETGFINAWRGHVLMGIGLFYVLISPLVALNPWWGAMPATVIGPPVFNTLALAFAAPALLALAAARRLYDYQRISARVFAGAGGVLLLAWAILEVRRLFRGAEIATAPVGLFEGACYALLLLAAALAVAVAARMRAARGPERPFTADLSASARTVAWAAIVPAAFILLLWRHPIWGMQDGEASNAYSTLLAVIAQIAAVVLALFLGRALSVSRKVEITRFAAAAAALLFAWSYGHAAIGWYHHNGYVDNGEAPMWLENLLHAVWPLAFTLGVAYAAARAPGRDTVRAYVHDLQALCATAVWPTSVFTALGLWLLFNPWWGVTPADIASPVGALSALALYAAAAFLSTIAPSVPHARWPDWLARASTVAAAGHILVAGTLVVRRLYHGDDMSDGAVGGVEMWLYSAVWALFGAGAFVFGMQRNNGLLRWISLGVLVGAWLYVVLLSFTQLRGLTQIGAMLGLASVLLVVAWLARTNRLAPEAPKPTDLLTIKPSSRRERRHGRRQRSS